MQQVYNVYNDMNDVYMYDEIVPLAFNQTPILTASVGLRPELVETLT